ncbi:MAG: putative oxidoreductase C-terminal domain-containing protein [Bacteroidota bacterium]
MYKKTLILVYLLAIIFHLTSCSNEDKMNKFTGADHEVKLMTLDPGHFHAALVQKNQYSQVSPLVNIYAPEGEDVKDHIARINGFNSRSENPTNWKSTVYTGSDYIEKMISEKPGNVMITSGKNDKKIDYIKAAIDAGINVLADKPMCVDKEGFELLLKTFESARQNDVLLYDIMTERSEITTILQKEFIEIPEIFGEVIKGSLENPAVVKSSVHHFYKHVSGKPLKRPDWFFDSSQQGDGLVDVTTHLVDLVQWELFPEKILNYKTDVKIIEPKHWSTNLSLEQFSNVTKLDEFPEFFKSQIKDNILPVYCNGEINYTLKGIHAQVVVEWKYQAPEGGGDTHYSVIRGTKSNIIIKQGKEQNYKPELYIEAVDGVNKEELNIKLNSSLAKLQTKYPGVEVEKENDYWHITIPDKYRIGHEAHFGQVMERYLNYLVDGKLPDWEIPNMITKYYTTTEALKIANMQP